MDISLVALAVVTVFGFKHYVLKLPIVLVPLGRLIGVGIRAV